MSNKKTIHLKGLFLLIIYFISLTPTIFFHNHTTEKIVLETSNSCEKYIASGNIEKFCGHEKHFTKAIQKCSLCDNYIVNPHFSNTAFYSLAKKYFGKKNIHYKADYSFCNRITFTNRGPPKV